MRTRISQSVKNGCSPHSSVQKLNSPFVSVISRHKEGPCAFGCKDRVIGHQRIPAMIFSPANTRFNDQGAALPVGQHGLHGGIRGIDNLPFLHDLQCIIKTDFCLHKLFCQVCDCHAVFGILIGPLRVSVNIQQGSDISVAVHAMIGMTHPIGP